ncbi:MAG TPA: RICIN domain-containing protein, partial [Thermoanaerobaculia bacterium]|nr:RICIN domain-containing protein [Thermoanaerobaculia bacterium]
SWSSNTDEPNEHPDFDIKSGYQLVASHTLNHSLKCLDVYQGSMANGASLIQYDCGPPKTSLNQVFTLWPTAPGEYQIRVRKSGRCVDVTAGSQSPGQQLSQYDCLGAGQLNQIWRGEPMQYLEDKNVLTRFVAKHSNQCMDVRESSQANGGIVQQYPCIGTQPNQLWTFKSVESDPVPLDADVVIDELWHGHPGYVTFHGSVTSNGYDMDPYWVNVNFQKEVAPESWQTIQEASRAFELPPNGQFSHPWYWGLGAAKWRTRVVLQGEGPLQGEAFKYTYFTVRDGYRIKFRHSGRCLSASANGTANGTPFIQWDCSGASNPYEGQTFSFRPLGAPGSNYFQILPDTTAGSANPYEGKCVDVGGNTTTMGAALVLYQCLGPSQWNQIWNIVPISGQPPWFAAIAVHSNQCMDVEGQSTANGARIQQWGCYWGGNQQWQFIPVG